MYKNFASKTSIPENVIVPEYLKEMKLSGGYAEMESTDDMYFG